MISEERLEEILDAAGEDGVLQAEVALALWPSRPEWHGATSIRTAIERETGWDQERVDRYLEGL